MQIHPDTPATRGPECTDGDIRWLTVRGARQNNLKDVTVSFPLARFVSVTGVSGSGKSSLVNDILREVLKRELNFAEKVKPGDHDAIDGIEHLDKIVDIDQSPIGRTPRSNPGTYIKVFDQIRDLYTKLPDSKVRGYKPGRFSFNVPTGEKGGGRCEACEGNGSNRIEMDFLADVWVTCPVCSGKRFNRETLQILFKGKSIADVLDMDVADALDHFAAHPKIAHMLQTLHNVGLDYLKIGQSSTTLSGGEAQRIKLARELVRRSTGQTLYLLDEPTTGLHFEDIKRLLGVLHGFVDAGNTVVVVEHNLDVIKTADWVIDLGPEGGQHGGRIVAEGTPEDVARCRESHTGHSLAPVLGISTGKRRNRGTNGNGSANRKRAARRFDQITVHGARQHNLKDIDVVIPRSQTTVFSGPSGSGKSSLALDTIYAEGQRRYMESLSAYARQFLTQVQKPRVEKIEGLSPAIAIEQKSPSKSPRSTVGTVTEIYDYMRILWARIGTPHCPKCNVPIGTQTSDEIVERVLALPDGTRALVLAPIERATNETYDQLFQRERANGFSRVRVDGVVCPIDQPVSIDKRSRHAVELVVDRVIIRRNQKSRITDSIEQALTLGHGVVIVQQVEHDDANTQGSKSKSPRDQRFSQRNACDKCGKSYDELTPHHFSFNSRLGWCNSCEGLGTQLGASPDSIAINPGNSILDGALTGWETPRDNPAQLAMLIALADHVGFDPETPWHDLAEDHQLAILQGTGRDWIAIPNANDHLLENVRFRWRGFYPAIDRATRTSWTFRKRLEELVTDVPCNACNASRLRTESRHVLLNNQRIEDVCRISLDKAAAFFKSLKLDRREKRIAAELLREINARLKFLLDVGLDYLTINRPTPSLSGGESQRIRLASQIGSGLTGVLYVLDEPTIGLHPRDNTRLIGALQKLRDLGNTLIIVEHDREVIDHADHLLDFGPGAGIDGGQITAAASPAQIRKKRASLTGQYLAGKKYIPVPENRRPVENESDLQWLTVENARHNNLRDITAAFPLSRFTAITGVSGSGKSSLVSDTLHPALASRIHRARLVPGPHRQITGAEQIDKVINVDQSPIGNSPASNPATYTGIFDLIRELFAKLPDAKIRGYTANRFSFNRAGGRCEACLGMGQRCIEMHFLPDVWIECESCKGHRYLQDTLDVKYRDKSIADVLTMRVAQACELFDSIPNLTRLLKTLDDVGLGYLQLGQSAPTLSGGEAQRVKLASELGRPSTGKTLYILDEPTTGLHFDDLRRLLDVLHRLVDLGNTVICIEHNLDVIKTADWIIDIGPNAGVNGGQIVVQGTPETIAATKSSHTGIALKPILDDGPIEHRDTFSLDEQARVEKELRRPMRLTKSEAQSKMPWEIDGRRWHTVNHVDRNGQPVQWNSDVLEWVVETIETAARFTPTDWNDRARVEIRAPKTQPAQWFFHARTGGRDLIDISIRVPKRVFDNKTVVRKLKVKTLDQREDLPIYGREPRVKLRAAGREFDDIRILLRDFSDINKTAFTAFFKETADAYIHMVTESQEDPVKGQPWKADGRKWHLSQKSINAHHRIKWKPNLILEFFGRINKLDPTIEPNWNGKIGIGLKRKGQPAFGKIVTNMSDGLRLDLFLKRNQFTPLQVDKLGTNVVIRPFPDYDNIQCWIKTLDENDPGQLADVLAGTRDLKEKSPTREFVA